MQRLFLRYVFVPDPGPSAIAAWAARILFPLRRKRPAVRLPQEAMTEARARKR